MKFTPAAVVAFIEPTLAGGIELRWELTLSFFS